MKLLKNLIVTVFFLTGFLLPAEQLNAQGGDQMLDGIGETGLIARYIFNGDLKDWSRNNLHARFAGKKAAFVNDSRFGKVLSLSGQEDAFVILPPEIFNDLESLSISGWILLRSKQPEQQIFDFGTSSGVHLYASPGSGNTGAFHTTIARGATNQKTAGTVVPEMNKWMHFTIVMNPASSSLVTYLDNKPAGEVKEIPSELMEVFGNQEVQKNLFLGRSLLPGKPNLNALIHDFRIYRIPLNSGQVAAVFNHRAKGSGLNAGVVNTAGRRVEDDLPKYSPEEAQLYNKYLTGVANVEVETEVGNLPRLPVFVPGTYTNLSKEAGPKVRVLWPAPTDNTAVRKPGSYTISGRVPGTAFEPKATVIVKQEGSAAAPQFQVTTFPLDRVTLNKDVEGNQTQFIANRDKFINTLAQTDPNSFLYMFRHAYGQKQPEGAKPLGVWDSKDTKLRGHATGHYLTAIAQAYAGTGYDPGLRDNFAKKMEYMVNTLYDLSQLSGKRKEAGGPFVADPAKVPFGPGKVVYDSDLSDEGIRNDYWNWGKGFISAYPPDQFIMLEEGAKYGGQKNQIWAPYYTLHKILAGLIDVYEVSGNKKALSIATGMGDWVYSRLSKVPADTLIKMWNTYIAGEYGGMNESMAHLYRITSNQKYLETAKLFDNIRLFYGDKEHAHGLAKNVDMFRGLHANQHIPQIVGSIEMYRASHNPDYYRIADNFWNKAVNNYMYSIGGVAGARNPNNAECFTGEPATLYENGFAAGGQNETCATYNMLKLTGDLFSFDPRAEYMDYYERALYNDILASVAENTPANTYHIPLRPASQKQFGNPNMTGFTCCNGTALESSTKLQNSIYYKSADDKALYVNLFIPSTLEWVNKKMRIEQKTNFPHADSTTLIMHGNGKFDLYVRVPGWATNGFFVAVNGKKQRVVAQPGSYISIGKVWKDGDIISLKMPFQFHLDPVMDQPNIASLFYGPVLLAAQEPEARKEWRKVTLDSNDIGRSITGDPDKLEFTIDDVVYKPFYKSYGRYSVYLDVTLQ